MFGSGRGGWLARSIVQYGLSIVILSPNTLFLASNKYAFILSSSHLSCGG
jgi:hypothetical protein